MSTQFSIELAKHAKLCGKDTVSMVPPFYYKYAPKQIEEHYERVMDEANVNIILYNFLDLSGVNITDSSFDDLIDDDRVPGIKHTSMNLYEMERVIKKSKKTVLNGFDEVFVAGLSLGAGGGISGTGNVFIKQYKVIFSLYCEGKINEARDLQTRLNSVIEVVGECGVIASIKFIAEKYLGFECGSPREPFAKLTENQKFRLVSVIDENRIFNS